jgi:hypothetical protein
MRGDTPRNHDNPIYETTTKTGHRLPGRTHDIDELMLRPQCDRRERV